ncbi:malectin-like [Sycon ciliatum]|uniref:malectin-like n=1 Tax=Sycon ciliatum TaxID=27933 RepID=UPI0020A9BF94|eukprot:scpid78291/ scgid16919/ Malectin
MGILHAVAFLLLIAFVEYGASREVVYGVNCGGEAHTDSHGIKYSRDKMTEGTPSDFGKRMAIARANAADQILYQTERYHFKTFSYTVPLNREGNYVLVLKFSEVYFSGSSQKVFDVHLNGEPVVSELDIFDRVGKGVAHDDYVSFSVKSGQLNVNGNIMPFDGKLVVSFVKGSYDNPKCNAFYIMRGALDDVPRLPEVEAEAEEEEEEDTDEDDEQQQQQRGASQGPQSSFQKKSGRPKRNPYDAESTSWITPVVMALAIVLPLVFCLCRF